MQDFTFKNFCIDDIYYEGKLTLRNIYEALDAQTDAYLKIYTSTNTRKLYIEDLKRINPIGFELITYGYLTDDETSD